MTAPYRNEDLGHARQLVLKPMLLSAEARYALQLAVLEIDRCHERITELLSANNREVERRRAAEARDPEWKYYPGGKHYSASGQCVDKVTETRAEPV